jgi:hypothetical protein
MFSVMQKYVYQFLCNCIYLIIWLYRSFMEVRFGDSNKFKFLRNFFFLT